MPTEISRQFRFEAAHRLPNVPPDHKCARLHGHSFQITIVVGGDVHPEQGWIIDFAKIDEAWAPLHEVLDHRYLNDIEGLENPTSEILARWIWERISIPDATLRSVVVHETCNAAAHYRPDAP